MKEPHSLPEITIYGDLPSRIDIIKKFREETKKKSLPPDDLNLFLAWLIREGYIKSGKIVPVEVRE